MHWLRAWVLFGLCAVTSSARADDGESQEFFSLPLELGATTREDGRFTYGIRPELLFAPRGDRGFAIGPYAELARSSADTSLGAGVTVTYLLESKLNLAPGAGIYHRFAGAETGYEVSLFLGYRRSPDVGGLDVPLGVRIDYRADFSDHHEVIVVAQLDVIALVLWRTLGNFGRGMGIARARAMHTTTADRR